jgi:isoleucyl-tRNA synthetase
MDQPSSFFVQSELEVLNFWDQAQIFKQTLDKEAPQGEYRFYDGPPFATGTPHYGHIVASVMKDAVPRFWTMNGYRVDRRWGWDCHGLPVENIVEKELGYQHKKDIEVLGVDKFNELCRSKVLSYVDDWRQIIHRLGRFVDMDNAYQTMDLPFMESVWWVFKQLWDKGLIYQGYRSMHVCPRCETTLSQSEVAEGYREIKDLSCIAKFSVADQENTYFLAWTTTPWTLIGNVALAVGSEIEYVKIAVEQQWYIIAKERLADIFKDQILEIVKEYKGSELVGLKYEPLFDTYYNQLDLVNKKNGWQVYAADFVNTEDGTGIVHIAPAFGEDDLRLGQKNHLPFIQHVGMDGTIKDEVSQLAGLNVKPKDNHSSTDVEIIKYLAGHGLLFAKEKYEHSYPHCWRCDTPLINYATSSWFVDITKLKPAMLEEAKKINWSPDYIKDGRFGNWLEGARDWSISRQRYWASVMPLWQCSCGWQRVFGSASELTQASGQEVVDLHKHIVDQITIKCPDCGGIAHRVPDVLDTWFDSGSMPYAQAHYPFKNPEEFINNFPAQFIAEGIDQTRCWFYYLHVIGNGLGFGAAYRNVIVNGIVLAEDGKKMSKRLQNYPDPGLLMNKFGADALRYYLLASPVTQAENLNFSEKGVEEIVRKIILPTWNVYKFYDLYVGNERRMLSNKDWSSGNILDRWIVARLHQLLNEISQQMQSYNLPKATRPIADFIDDLSTWYLRRSRDRFKDNDDKDKQAALLTTGYVLQNLAIALAPFVPFLAEAIWQKAIGYNYQQADKSVHLLAWPEQLAVDESILTEMISVRQIAELALAQRDLAGFKVRQVLASLTVQASQKQLDSIRSDSWLILADELNVKQIIPQAVETGDWQISLDTNLTPELIREGLARELVRNINLLRKQAGLNLEDRTIIYWQSHSQTGSLAIAEWSKTLQQETLSSEVINDWPEQILLVKDLSLDDGLIKIGINKV